MSERDGIMLAIECVDRHNHGFIGCDPMFIHGYNEAVKTISKELGALLETPLIGGDYFEGFSEGIKVGRNEMIEASEEVTRLREENARLREALKPFARMEDRCLGRQDVDYEYVPISHIRAAAAALKETGDE